MVCKLYEYLRQNRRIFLFSILTLLCLNVNLASSSLDNMKESASFEEILLSIKYPVYVKQGERDAFAKKVLQVVESRLEKKAKAFLVGTKQIQIRVPIVDGKSTLNRYQIVDMFASFLDVSISTIPLQYELKEAFIDNLWGNFKKSGFKTSADSTLKRDT